MQIYFDEETRPEQSLAKELERAAILICNSEEIDPDRVSLNVSLVGGEEIHELNREYRGVDRVTDVLSFPQFSWEEYDMGWDEVSLGDVVMCLDKIEEQAKEFGHSKARETMYLFVHSVLHLLGYDHEEEEDKKLMRAREEEIMKELDLER